MGRTPMVTRTITTTRCNVLCMNVKEGIPFEQEVTIPRTYPDTTKMLKQVAKMIDNESTKAVHIKSYEECETLYGMTESEFISHAEVLPPRVTNETEHK